MVARKEDKKKSVEKLSFNTIQSKINLLDVFMYTYISLFISY